MALELDEIANRPKASAKDGVSLTEHSVGELLRLLDRQAAAAVHPCEILANMRCRATASGPYGIGSASARCGTCRGDRV